MTYRALSKYRAELMGVAILWVMAYHSFDLDLQNPILNQVKWLGYGGVDIFILLSAMSLVMSLGRQEQDYSAFMARRAGRLLPAYYVVMIPYTLFLISQGRGVWSALFWNATLLQDWVQPQGAFNWYMTAIMTFYAITPMCFRLLRGRPSPQPAAEGQSAGSRNVRHILLVAAGTLLSGLVARALQADGFWSHLYFMCRVPLFLLGLLMGFYVLEERRLAWADTLFWWVWAGLGAVFYVAVSLGEVRNPPFFPMIHLFLFTTVPMCLALCWLFEHLPLGWLRRPLRFLGTYSLEIYLLNVTLFAEYTLLRRFVSFGPSNRLYFLLSYAANIALAPVLHRLAELLRHGWRKLREREALPG